jgi:hypothetical protein
MYAVTVMYWYVHSMMALWLIFLTVHMRAVLEAVEVEVEVEVKVKLEPETASGLEASRHTASGSGTR